MALTKIGSIGINTGIQFAGVTTITTLNSSSNVLSVGGTVNFVSEIITCARDSNNKVIEGNPEVIKTVHDVWKFSKNMWSQDPTWYLVETSSK